MKDPKQHPRYIDGRSLGFCVCIDCGNQISETSVNGNKRCNKCSKIGKLNPAYSTGITLIINKCKDCKCILSMRGGHKALRCRKCNAIYLKTKLLGKNNPNYKHGRGYSKYPLKFNKEFKLKIRTRDNFTCQNCGLTEKEHLKTYSLALDVHHIDYNKPNCDESNLITVCKLCNNTANSNRDYWFAYYTYKMENK